MKRNLIIGMMALAISLSAASCKKDKTGAVPTPGTPSASKEKNIKYTLIGNYTGGRLNVTYFQSNGGIGSVPLVTSLPWEKEITYENSVQGVSFSAAGNSGQEGQTVTAKIFVNGKEVKTATGTVDDRGIVVVGTGTHIF